MHQTESLDLLSSMDELGSFSCDGWESIYTEVRSTIALSEPVPLDSYFCNVLNSFNTTKVHKFRDF